MKILIIKTSSLGDIIHSFPAIEDIKKNYPESLDSLKYEKDNIATIPFQRKASCDEIAEAIRFLVSDESVFMTGAEITIDGGLIAQ